MGFKHPLATVEESAALDRAEASFDLVRSYAWPVSGAHDDEQRAALEEAERDSTAQRPHEFKPVAVVRETDRLEDEF